MVSLRSWLPCKMFPVCFKYRLLVSKLAVTLFSFAIWYEEQESVCNRIVGSLQHHGGIYVAATVASR